MVAARATQPAGSRPPIVRNAFVGRDAPLRDVVRRLSLPDGRLVTLVGRSGVGKTRLALEVARRLTASYPGGIALIELCVPDARAMEDRVSAALGVRTAPGQSARDALERRLQDRPILLIADDVDATPGALEALLDLAAEAPAVRILATAQRPSGHGEEHVVRLRPLAASSAEAAPAVIRAAPAVTLYLARATVANPSFAAADADLPLIAELCRRLDGLPLAIELGAARARILSPASQLEALDHGDALALRAPRGDRRPVRHQDLRSALEVTWSMTEPSEQLVLRRMAVFSAPPTLELLHAVASPPGWTTDDLLDALGDLVDLGLVEPEEVPGEETRYHLLPTIRALGLEHLTAAGEDPLVRAAHQAAFLDIARGTRGLPEGVGASVLGREAIDLAVVLDGLEADGRIGDALELASDLVRLWARVGVSALVRATYDRLLRNAETPGSNVPPAIVARGLVGIANLAIQAPTAEEARQHAGSWLSLATALARDAADREALLLALEWTAISVIVTADVPPSLAANAEGLALAADIGDEVALTRFEYRTSMFAGMAGDLPTAIAAGTTALRRARAVGDPESLVRTALHLAWFPRDAPGMPSELPSLEDCQAIARANGLLFEEGTTYPLIGFSLLLAGDLPGAAASCADGLGFATRYGAWHAATFSLVALVMVAGAVGDQRLVARLHGVLLPAMAEALQGQIPQSRPLFLAAIATARTSLGEADFAEEEAATGGLDREAAIDWARGAARRLSGADDIAPPVALAARGVGLGGVVEAQGSGSPRLTPRERDVLREMRRGATNREIGATLGLAEKTVMHHSVSIYAKLGVRGRTEATAWAAQHGYLDGEPD